MARKGKVLIVDDEKDLTLTLKQFLTEENYDTFTALNGEDALKILEKEKPHLVILDIKMPGINGIEVLKIIKAKYPKTKVVILTAYDEENKTTVEKIGSDGFLAKPCGMAVLTNKILELLEGKKTAFAEIRIKEQIPKAKILFIEQGTMVANMLKYYFSDSHKAGGEYQTIFVRDRQETEKELSSFKPDLVVINYSTVKDPRIVNMVMGSSNKPKETLIWGFDIDSFEKVANKIKKVAINHGLVKK